MKNTIACYLAIIGISLITMPLSFWAFQNIVSEQYQEIKGMDCQDLEQAADNDKYYQSIQNLAYRTYYLYCLHAG